MRRLNLVVRTDSAPLSLVGAIRKTISALDKDQPMSNPVILERMDSDSLMPQRSLAVLIGIFALVAVGLASIGIYGVMSYFVTRRIHEIGIRMALGAQPHEVHWLVLRQGLKLTLIGLALGLVAALNLTKLLSSYIFGISPTDPGTFAIVSVVLTMVGLLASYIPARKATKVDPMVAFRSE
jgi:putative ABC transport system permease protein